MIVELGNRAATQAGTEHGEPAVTTIRIPDEATHTEGADAVELMRHLTQNPDITRLPGMEAFVSVVRIWPMHSSSKPAWVASDNADMQRLLSEYWDVPQGKPDDVEQTHHTLNGPPGVSA